MSSYPAGGTEEANTMLGTTSTHSMVTTRNVFLLVGSIFDCLQVLLTSHRVE